MVAGPDCAAWKVLYYAKLYSGRADVYRAANLPSVKKGWPDSINKITLSLFTCDKCNTEQCENLAKSVAHAWLKAYKVPDKSLGTTTSGKPLAGACTKSTVSEDQAAALILLRAENKCLQSNNSFFSKSQNNRNGILNAQCYMDAIKNIRAAKARGDCATVERYTELAGAAMASQSKCNLYQANAGCAGGGSIKTTPTPGAPRPTGTDSDCYHWGGDWLGGALDGFCTAGKKLTKGAETGIQNPLNQYLPIMLIGMGFIAVLMLAKK